MSRTILNIRGTNGSGKSSIIFSMMDDPKKYLIEKSYKGKMYKIATVFPSYGWVALGAYEEGRKCGGLDTMPNNEITKKSFWYILKKYPTFNLVMEGIICSTIFSTYCDLFKEAKEKYPEDDIVILHLTTPLKVCLKRIQKRNGGKPIKEDLVKNKVTMINRAVDKFRDEFIVIDWDTKSSLKNPHKLIYQVEELILDNTVPF